MNVAFMIERGDSENMMTPNRWAMLQARKAAEAEMRKRAERRARGLCIVQPIGSSKHQWNHGQATFIGGILFADGSIHTFDREAMMHSQYARALGKHIACGGDFGPDGWGFYWERGEFTRWCVPVEVADEVEAVMRKKFGTVTSIPTTVQRVLSRPRTAPGLDARTMSSVERHSLAAERRSQAARKAIASRTPEQRKAAARKAVETRKRREAARRAYSERW